MLTHLFTNLINVCPARSYSFTQFNREWEYSCCRSVQVTCLPTHSGKVVKLSLSYWIATLLKMY